MRDVFPQRDVNSRTRGPAVTSAGDGLEGVYSGVLHTVPSGGACKVLIPAFSLTSYYTAKCPTMFSGAIGDAVLVAFDEQKQPWLIVPSALALTPVSPLAWIAPTLINSWVNAGAPWETAAYLKDPLGFVHLKGVVKSGATNTVAFVLPAGYRPGASGISSPGQGSAMAWSIAVIDTAGNVTIQWQTAATLIGLSGITFLAEH